jgi:LCP family protein required for cell wall assembly
MIVIASAAASAAFAFNELDKLVDALGQGRVLNLGEELAEAEAGQPQTIMLIGSDKRADTPVADPTELSEPRSDTVILVRLDPSKEGTALMSLPRDLKVNIPGHGTDRLNAAYSLGGPKLVVETVKELTGLRINHVVNIDFGGFIQAVDELGCVYVDVDHSYFSSGEQFAYVNLDPGYQRLCGDDALGYVRFRHEDNDLVRSARQQEFLRQAKEQFTVQELISRRDKLLEIFGRHTDSDIDSRDETLRLLKLAIAAAGQPVREVHFEGNIGTSFVTASDAQVKELAQDFLGVRDTSGPRSGEEDNGDRRGGRGDDRPDADLIDATADGQAQAQQAEAQNADFPIFFPTERLEGAVFSEEPSVYWIQTGENRKEDKERAYRMVLSTGLAGEYYGLQGTTWDDPPILESPTESRTIGGREYQLHYDGDRLRMVAWRAKDAAYWVSNTLLQSLSEEEMLGIATSAREL